MPIKSLPQCIAYPAVLLWNRTQPAGFFYKNVWHSDICKSSSFVDYNKCLKNTSLLMIGDSTLRQWYHFLEQNLRCSRITETWTNATWHRMTTCSKPSLMFRMEWIPHSQPCFLGERWMANNTLASVSKVMDQISNNTRVVIVFMNFGHLLKFHHSVYQIRMRKISKSARKLLQRNQNAKIFIKGPHTFVRIPGISDDYFGNLFKHIIYKEFKGLHDAVFYLDHTDMTIATDQRNVHPTAEVVGASVYQMVNYICAAEK